MNSKPEQSVTTASSLLYYSVIHFSAGQRMDGSQIPRKLRQLKADLKQAGFLQIRRRGKGSHSAWQHPNFPDTVVLSGTDGGDAKPYQEKQVDNAIKSVKPRT